MEFKEIDSKRGSVANAVLNPNNKKNSLQSISSNSGGGDQMRRPFGVAAIDLTPIIRKPEDFKNNLDLPFILCEKEFLDNTLKKLILNKDVGKIDSKLAVSVELLHGDIKQVCYSILAFWCFYCFNAAKISFTDQRRLSSFGARQRGIRS